MPRESEEMWSKEAREVPEHWWMGRLARQKEIDASIAAQAEFEQLYDRPYEDGGKVRVAEPFTVESTSPYCVLHVDENEDVIDPAERTGSEEGRDFTRRILDNLKTGGVQQAHKEDRITLTSIEPFQAGKMICAIGAYQEGDTEKTVAIFIGP